MLNTFVELAQKRPFLFKKWPFFVDLAYLFDYFQCAFVFR